MIRGIGVVHCVYVNPTTGQFWVIDYRIFDPERDRRTKLAHVEEMLKMIERQALAELVDVAAESGEEGLNGEHESTPFWEEKASETLSASDLPSLHPPPSFTFFYFTPMDFG